MKRVLVVLFLSVLLVSCSSDNDPEIIQEQAIMFFPLTTGSYWTFNNESEAGVSRDSLYVNGIEQINGKTYTNLDAMTPVTGFMTQLLSENMVHYTGSKLLLNGELSSPIIDGFPGFSIDLNEFVLLDTAVSTPGTILSSVSGEISEVIMELPLVFDYELRSVHNSMTNNGSNELIETQIILTLAVAAEIDVAGIILSIPILSSQDVMVTSNTYSEDIGLQNSTTIIEYELEDLSGTGIEFPFPSQGTSTAFQVLDTHFIGD